jgi:hypothetical protein
MTTITTIKGDLLQADVDIIVQQCNCITISALGLSEAIKSKLQVDPYGHRRPQKGKRNCAIEEDRTKPGTILIYDRQTNNQTLTTQRYVACLFAQYSPGKSGIYHQKELPEGIKDTKEQRLDWFKECLKLLKIEVDNMIIASSSASSPDQPNKVRIGLPYLIGCGLAGGNWQEYKKALDTWATTFNPDQVEILLVHKE